MTYGCEACAYDSEQMILGMLLMKCIFRKDQLVMEHLITLYHEDRDPTLPSAQFVWQPCGSYIFGCCLGVSLHWSCIMILWM
ncbi:hypothetical protein BDL97_19G026700 [Sphagnum fallax]|nr:hypothetical protein BDL97_19G026700 [Sphagnum fallax]